LKWESDTAWIGDLQLESTSIGLLSPALSSRGGEGEAHEQAPQSWRRPGSHGALGTPSPPLEERAGERRPF
jgi:hypothetical protein